MLPPLLMRCKLPRRRLLVLLLMGRGRKMPLPPLPPPPFPPLLHPRCCSPRR